MKNRVRLVSGLALALGMAGLVVIPVSASTFDDGTDTLTLEETAANGAGYEWGLSEADSAKFMASLNAGKKIKIEDATKEGLIKNLAATQKFFDDAKAEGPTGLAKIEAFKAAMQKLANLDIVGTEDFVIDDELAQKVKSVIIDNEMVNQTEGIKELGLRFVGKKIIMTGLSEENFDQLFAVAKLRDLQSSEIVATPHIAKKILKMNQDSIDAGNPPILPNADRVKWQKPDMEMLKSKIKEGKEKYEAEKANDKLAEELRKLNEVLRNAEEILNDQFSDENDRDQVIRKIAEGIKAIDDKKNSLGAPNSGYQTAVLEAGNSDMLVAGVTAVTVAGVAVAFARKKR